MVILTPLTNTGKVGNNFKTEEVMGEFTAYFIFSCEFSIYLNTKNLAQHKKIQPRNIY